MFSSEISIHACLTSGTALMFKVDILVIYLFVPYRMVSGKCKCQLCSTG